jgi:Phosphotransferase enzyme family
MLAEAWAGENLRLVAPAEVVRERTWARTSRLETSDGAVWLKECAATHRFEAALVPLLAERWPDLLPRVLAHDAARGWLLLADAGVPFDRLDNPPELWLRLLPRYAELQRDAPVPSSLPDRTVQRWPALFEELAGSELPLDPAEAARLRAYAPRFAELCGELPVLPAAVQHDDLHHRNAFADGDCLRIIDWGDACSSHPFVSLVVAFRFLEERNGLRPGDPWFSRLRDAYLEPWGGGLSAAFDLSQRIGRFVHAFGWATLRRQLPAEKRAAYDVPFAVVLRRALACT